MTSDTMRPQDSPEDRDPGTGARGADAEQALELLQALARKQQQPAAPVPPAESPLDELARLISEQMQTPAPGALASPAEGAEPPLAPPRPERRPRKRRSFALLPSRRATLAIGALLLLAVASAGAVSVWWSASVIPTRLAANADVLAQAMAECDAEAAKSPDTLHFLVIPLKPASSGLQKWTSVAVQQAGESYLLLSSQDALSGLRDGSLAPYTGKFAFSIVEPTTGTRHSWPPTTGPTKFSEADAGNLTSIRLAFAFADLDSEPKLSAEFLRQKGDCYWVSVLVRP